jgi:hypothetical protein
MKAKFLVPAAIFAVSVISDAKADEIWTYTSPLFPSGDYITATVDINCTGTCSPGTYSYGSGINDITLSGYSSANTLIESLSLPGGTPWNAINYLDIASDGTISDFFFDIYAAQSVYASEILVGGYVAAKSATENVYGPTGQIFVAGPGYIDGDLGFPCNETGSIAFQEHIVLPVPKGLTGG